ncbi:hypothetical protein LC087_15960 [Bacillus carboniphilus]|uniref:Aminoglycoside phosphotransferase domain-containing protein n=1 Tax=Bacillus carboniphilus TaxID=86663 RepID=A0ABY9JS29_9BACI|nr:hypothetical protein [Bacillus carboniphilus]WLR42216.1 hypothetical protein LC087_15960 [Bacillus carboniphilus]
MKFLTTEKISELELINYALKKEGVRELSHKTEINKLGEGAWHYAYLIEKEQLVLRIPKRTAYDQAVVFNREELMVEYASTKAFYQHANKAKEGVCPTYFNYFVQAELTYTMESFLGESIAIGNQTIEQSKYYGRELGEVFLALESLDPPFEGIGYLQMGGNGELKGQIDMDLKEFILQETKDYVNELNSLISSDFEFDKEKVLETARKIFLSRSIESEKRVLTNQDTSPENIIFAKTGVKIIDPYPLIYSGSSLAANHVFNYSTFFPTANDTIRYGRGNYHLYKHHLQANAEGFIEGYTDGSLQKRRNINAECFFKLVSMADIHYQLLNEKSLNREQTIRFGTKEQIEKRLKLYLYELECFSLSMI